MTANPVFQFCRFLCCGLFFLAVTRQLSVLVSCIVTQGRQVRLCSVVFIFFVQTLCILTIFKVLFLQYVAACLAGSEHGFRRSSSITAYIISVLYDVLCMLYYSQFVGIKQTNMLGILMRMCKCTYDQLYEKGPRDRKKARIGACVMMEQSAE